MLEFWKSDLVELKIYIIIENLNFLVWDSFCYENFVIDKSHVEKNCSKKKLK
jgi:hypothetical protein